MSDTVKVDALAASADFASQVLEAVQCWGGDVRSLVAATNNQRALNRLAHQVVCEQLGIVELTYPFYLTASDDIRADLSVQEVKLPDKEFERKPYDEWSWNSKWEHLALDTRCGHFVLIHFANSQRLDLKRQFHALSNLGYMPARLDMTAPFVKRCGGGLGLCTMTPGIKEYALLGTNMKGDGDNQLVPVLSQPIAREGWKRGRWELSLRPASSLFPPAMLLVQAVDRYDLQCRLPGPLQYTKG